VGTGINAHPEFASKVIGWMVETTGIAFTEATDHFEAQGAQDACVELSGALKTVAVSLTKIANDVRILGSGPRCGIAELILPATQPGSSIMPGKVNPVIAESLVQACAQVIGNDTAITHGGIGGFFELNVSMPLIARNLLESCELIGRAAGNFGRRCIDGLKADTRRIEGLIEQSLMLATPLAPVIGYDAAAKLAKEAHETGKTIRQVALDKMVLPVEELQKILDPSRMARGKKE
jgi:fumarate hydratase class II